MLLQDSICKQWRGRGGLYGCGKESPLSLELHNHNRRKGNNKDHGIVAGFHGHQCICYQLQFREQF